MKAFSGTKTRRAGLAAAWSMAALGAAMLLGTAIGTAGATGYPATGHEAISICNVGNGQFKVSGSGWALSTDLIVWAGDYADLASANTDGTGTFNVFFPNIDLSLGVLTVTTSADPGTIIVGPVAITQPLTSCNTGVDAATAAAWTMTASPTSIVADGSSTSTITVHGTRAGGSLTFSSTLGTVGSSSDLGNGNYVVTLTAGSTTGTATITATVDGNPVGGTGYSIPVTLTQAAPGTPTITGGPTDGTNSTTATFTFTGDPNTTGFLCSLDGGSFTICATGVTYSGITLGSHDFQVEATGSGGRTSSPVDYSWSVVQGLNPTGCNFAGTVHASQDWTTVSGKKNVKVHVELEGDCDLDKRTNTLFLHHGHLVLHVDGWATTVSLDEDEHRGGWGKAGNVAGVQFSGSSDAVVTGTYGSQAFTVTLHDGGKGGGNRNDTVRVQIGSLDTSTLSTGHSNVDIKIDGSKH